MIYLITNQKQTFDFNANIKAHHDPEFALDYLNNLDSIGADTETEGFDPHTKNLYCIQLGDDQHQFIFDFVNSDYRKALKPLIESKITIWHNAKFDLRFLYSIGIYPKVVKDTFLQEIIIKAGLIIPNQPGGLGLKDVVRKYCKETIPKEDRGLIHRFGLFNQRVLEYCAKDVQYSKSVCDKQLTILDRKDLSYVEMLENEVVKVFAKMEYDGVKLNTDKLDKVIGHVCKELHRTEVKLDNVVCSDERLSRYCAKQLALFDDDHRSTDVNWSSNKQKLDIINTVSPGFKSVSDRELRKNKNKHSIISLYLDYAKWAKLESSFGDTLKKKVNRSTSRVHPDYWQILNTGRISVKDPNVNQIPSRGDMGKAIRSCFVAEPGYKIVGGDYSGMELRIIAEFSQDPLWVNTFKEGGDLHSILCSKTFDIPIDSVKDKFPNNPDMTYRDVQKTINFGLAYGMSEFKLADTIEVPVKEAKDIIDKFFSSVPKVKEFLDTLEWVATNKMLIRTAKPFRRIRHFSNNNDPGTSEYWATQGSIGRAGKNMVPQGTNADIIKLALVKTQDYIDNHKIPAKIILSVYDEIQTECRSDVSEEWADTLEKIMIESAESVIKTVPIKVDCGVSDYWTK